MKINDVKHQGFAAAVLLRYKTRELMHCAQFGPAEPPGNFTGGQRSHFKFDQTLNPCFDLLRTVQQGGGHDGHAGRGITQYVAFQNGGYKLKLVHCI